MLVAVGMEPEGWTRSLKTGHEALDVQHLELFGLHATACGAVRSGEAQAVREALQELRDRTRRHFDFEERHMAESAYPSRRAHADAHVAFMRDLESLAAEVGRNACSSLVRLWLESRYASWWAHHLRSQDAGLANHLAAVAAAAAAAAAAEVEAAAAAGAEASKPAGARKA